MERLALFLLWILPFTFAEVVNTNSSEGNNTANTIKCIEEHEYKNLDVREVIGKWRAVELYMHLSKEGVNTYVSCPYLTIWESDEFPRSTYGVCSQLFHFTRLRLFKSKYILLFAKDKSFLINFNTNKKG